MRFSVAVCTKPRRTLACDCHADRRDHLVLSESLAVEEQRNQIVAVQPPFHQRAQLARTGAFEPSRHRRRTQPERLRHGLGASLVLARRQSAEHLVQEARVARPRLLQARIGGQRDFHAAMLIADPRHLDRQFLVGQIHRAALTGPAHVSRQSPLSGRYRAPARRHSTSACNSSITLSRATGINAWINATRASMSGAVVTGAGIRPTCFPFLRICLGLCAPWVVPSSGAELFWSGTPTPIRGRHPNFN